MTSSQKSIDINGMDENARKELLDRVLEIFKVPGKKESFIIDVQKAIDSKEGFSGMLEGLALDSINLFNTKIDERMSILQSAFNEKSKNNFNQLSNSSAKIINTHADILVDYFDKSDKIIRFAERFGIDVSQNKSRIFQKKAEFTKMCGGIGDSYEDGSWAIENSQFYTKKLLFSVIDNMSVDESLRYLISVHTMISQNHFRSDIVRSSNLAFAKDMHRLIYLKIKNIQDTKTRNIEALRLVNVLTGRKNDLYSDIDSSLRDPGFAISILSEMMDAKGGVFDKMITKENIQIDDPKLTKKPGEIISKFKSVQGGEDLIRKIGFGSLLEINLSKDYKSLSFQDKIKVSVLDRFITEMSGNSLTVKDAQLIFSKISSKVMEELCMPLKGSMQWNSLKSKPASYYGLDFAETEIYTLFQDIVGSGFDLSDESIKTAKDCLNMGMIIGSGIVTAIGLAPFTAGMSLPSGAAVLGGAIGITSVGASALIEGKGYDDMDDAMKDLGSQVVLSGLTGAGGGAFSATFLKMGAGVTTLEGVKRFTFNAGVASLDTGTGVGTESLRQKLIMGKDVDLEDMIIHGGPMLAVAIIAGSYKGEKINFKNIDGVREVLDYEVVGNTLAIKNIKNTDTNTLTQYISRLILRDDIGNIIIDEGVSHEGKRALNNVISKNFPLIEIVRLIKGSKVVNVITSGGKVFNDTISMKFSDQVMNAFKSIVTENFDRYAKSIEKTSHGPHARLIRSDNKNITFSIPTGVEREILFSGFKSKDEIIDIMISRLTTQIDQAAKDTKMTRQQIQQLIRENFDFGMGVSNVPTSVDKYSDLLRAFYGAEITSRNSLGGTAIRSSEYKLLNIEELAKSAVSKENEILSKYSGKKFTFEGVEYSITVKTLSGEKINPILVSHIRKKADIKPNDLKLLVRGYLDDLNAGLDFISPLKVLGSSEFDEASAKSHAFHSGEISPMSVMTNYKGVMSKQAFYEAVKGKSGLRVMLDIEDMFVENVESNAIIARKIASGKYDQDDLLKAGNDVTLRFVKFVNSIRSKYKDSLITLGGDEKQSFFPNVKPHEVDEIIKDINDLLRENRFKGRVTYSMEKGGSELFDVLDKRTSFNKMFKGKFTRAFEKFNMDTKKNSITTVVVDIDNRFPLGIDAKSLGEMIDDNIMRYIIQTLDTDRECRMIFKIGDQDVNVYFTKGQNGLLRIDMG